MRDENSHVDFGSAKDVNNNSNIKKKSKKKGTANDSIRGISASNLKHLHNKRAYVERLKKEYLAKKDKEKSDI